MIAVIGKTEGNGGVNDFSRILADQSFRAVLRKHGTARSEDRGIPMVWSGGCDGVIAPHATFFARDDQTGPANESRLVLGAAHERGDLPEDIGRPAMVEKSPPVLGPPCATRAFPIRPTCITCRPRRPC